MAIHKVNLEYYLSKSLHLYLKIRIKILISKSMLWCPSEWRWTVRKSTHTQDWDASQLLCANLYGEGWKVCIVSESWEDFCWKSLGAIKSAKSKFKGSIMSGNIVGNGHGTKSDGSCWVRQGLILKSFENHHFISHSVGEHVGALIMGSIELKKILSSTLL